MNSIYIKISNIKQNLIEEDINAILKEKLKPIKNNYRKNTIEEELIKEYNYYIKLIKKLRKYSQKELCKVILKKSIDIKGNIVYIVITIKINVVDVGIPIDIRVISGNNNESYMDCTYYQNEYSGLLYINNFRSIVANKGYGSILLKNIDYIIENINNILKKENMKKIEVIKGNLVADKNVISESILRQIYKNYKFEIDHENNIKRKVESVNHIKI